MNNREAERQAARRAKSLNEKMAGNGWNLDTLLAYCQGRAFEAGSQAASLAQLTASKREALVHGLLAMVVELEACAEALEVGG